MTHSPLQLVIVDDFAEDRVIIRSALLKGLERRIVCHEAKNGEEAIQLYAQTQQGAPAFDLFLLDLNLPDINGIEVLQELKGNGSILPFPVVVLTGAPREEEARAALAAGAQDFIAKSQLTPEALSRTVLNAIERFRLVQALQASEERSRRQLAELQIAESAERNQRRLTEALLNGLTALTGSLDVESVMQQLLACAATVVPSDAGSVILFTEAAGKVAYLRGFGPEAAEFFKEYRFPLSAMAYDGVAASITPYLIADTAAYPQWINLAVTTWIRSSLRIPIEVHGTAIGLLTADSAISHHFQPSDLEKLQAFARYASLALEKAEYITNLEARVAARTVDLRAAKERVEAILENSLDAILLVHTDLYIEQVNPAFHRLFGGDPQAYQNQPLLEVVEPGERERVAAVLRAAVIEQSGQQLETRMQRNDGTLFHAELSIGHINQTGLVCTLRDITERKEAEEQLRKSEARYRLLAENITDMVARYSATGEFLYASPSCHTLLGYEPEELLGQSGFNFVHPADLPLVQQTLATVFADQGAEQVVTCRYRHKAGHYLWLEFAFRIIHLPQTGAIHEFVVSARDITERKQAEVTLQQALQKEKELGELKSRFISMASHEFRTPLAGIRATSDTLLNYRQRLTDEQIDRRLGRIQEQVDYLTGIIDDVLQLARFQARRVEFNPVLLDLDDLCRTLIEELQGQTEGAERLRYSIDGNLHAVNLDPKLMQQIMANLLSNALKYSPPDKPVVVSLTDDHNVLTLEVRDEGIGIPTADLEHLFQPFHRASNVGTIAGTGLGLTITKESVELQGGTLRVTSEVGVGTTFTICIPLDGRRE